MILAISWAEDEHAQAILGELRRLGATVRLLDLARFPRELTLAMRYGGEVGTSFVLCDAADGPLDTRDVDAVWWRRPRHFTLHPEVTRASHQVFAYNEAHEAFGGLWQVIEAHWINQPLADQAAGRKVYQLRVASDLGLRIPETLVTNDPREASAFTDAIGTDNVIYKSFSATEREWRETRLLRPGEIALLDHVRYAPVIFQEYIRAAADLRITIVGSDVFPAAIYSQSTAYPVDFRIDMARAHMETVELPEFVRAGLLQLMSRLGLVYGAIDMRLTPEGEYVFLEVNPAGQWLFVEQRTGMRITQSLALALAQGKSGQVGKHPIV